MASLAAVHEVVLIATSDGTLTADVRPLVRVNVSVIVEQNGRREQGYSGGGGRFGLDELLRGDEPFEHGREAVRQALVNLEAVAAPAGSMPVVLGSGWPGILLHEAIGHGLEGDFNRKGTSAFSNRIGHKVAADEITVVDDGTLDRRRGSLNVDDEGTPTQCTVLIENGILRGYIQDKMNARLMGMPATGNGRRESFAHMTLPRMTNTYMRAGSRSPEEIIASVEKGLYAVNSVSYTHLVYALIIGAFIPQRTVWGGLQLQGIVLFVLYVAGVVSAMGVAYVLKRSGAGSKFQSLLLELPAYHWPSLRSLGIGLWQRVEIFLSRVGTIILALMVVLWALSSFPAPPPGATGPAIQYSVAGHIGAWLAVIFAPIGFNWQISVALVPGLAAREVAVGALGTVYALSATGADMSGALTPLIAHSWSLPTCLLYTSRCV